MQTKTWVFEVCSALRHWDWKGLKALFKKELDFDLSSGTGQVRDREELEVQTDYFWINLVLYGSFMLNYVYRVTMENLVAEAAHSLILAADSVGLDFHFMRFLYWALLPEA